jgi:hypothetical protein
MVMSIINGKAGSEPQHDHMGDRYTTSSVAFSYSDDGLTVYGP